MLDVDHIEAVHRLLGVVHSSQALGLRLPGLVDVGHAALVPDPLQDRGHHQPLGPGLIDASLEDFFNVQRLLSKNFSSFSSGSSM